jgi:mRNA interferase RelE/StbE
MDVEYGRNALKVLRRVQQAKATDIMNAVDRIATNPFAPSNNDIRSLKGMPDGFRLRVGDWRASYTLDQTTAKLKVFEIAPRGAAYR